MRASSFRLSARPNALSRFLQVGRGPDQIQLLSELSGSCQISAEFISEHHVFSTKDLPPRRLSTPEPLFSRCMNSAANPEKGIRETGGESSARFTGMKPAQDKPHEPSKRPEPETKEPQFSEHDAEGKALANDRRQHSSTVDQPDNNEEGKSSS